MDIKTELLNEHSRRTADRIVSWIGADAKRFRILMELFLKGEYLVTQRAAMAVGICTDRNPALAGPYVGRMLARMEQSGVHIAARKPDLGRELRLVIEHQTPYGSKGYCSRAARILKELEQRPARAVRSHAPGTLTEEGF